MWEMLKPVKNSSNLLTSFSNCCKWGALIWIFLFTQSITILESLKTCNWDILLFMAKFRTKCSAASYALLLVQCPGANLAWILWLLERYSTPPDPPSGGSPWLAPSKKAQGISLFISGGTRTLIFGSFSWDICSLTHYITRSDVTLGGISLLLKLTDFLAHQIP